MIVASRCLPLPLPLVSAVTPPHLQGPGFRLDDKYKTVNIYKLSRHFCYGAFRKLITWYGDTRLRHPTAPHAQSNRPVMFSSP